MIDKETLEEINADVLNICSMHLSYPVSPSYLQNIRKDLNKEFICKYPEILFTITFYNSRAIKTFDCLKKFLKSPINFFKSPREIKMEIFLSDWFEDRREILKYTFRPILNKDSDRILCIKNK